MALLGSIRKRSWLLIIVIGVAMVCFLLGSLKSGNLFGNRNELGCVNGTPITIQDYNKTYNQLSQNPQLRDAGQNVISQNAWNILVSNAIVAENTDKLGLKFTDQEYYEAAAMFFSSIQPNLIDKNGTVNVAATQQFLAELKKAAQSGNEQAQAIYQQWDNADPEATMLRANFVDLVSRGVLATTAGAQFAYQANTDKADISYSYIDYATFNKNNNLQVSDNEIKDYLKKHKKQFKPEATVNLAFAYFPAKSSNKDTQQILSELNSYLAPQIIKDEANGITDTIPSFANAKNASEFVAKYSQDNFDPTYYTKQQIDNLQDENLKKLLSNMQVGKVYGPIKTGNIYELIKVNDAKPITDSAKTSHILISYAGAQGSSATRTPQEAKKLADSILNVVKTNPTKFNEFASGISDDKVAAKDNGSIGWVSRNQQGFDPSYLQFAITKPKGTIDMIQSPFGFHIIRIDDLKTKMGYQFATIKKTLEASEATQDALFNTANNLALSTQGKSTNDFINAARKSGAEVNNADGVTRFQTNITGLSETKKESDILAWAFSEDTKPGTIQKFETANGGQIVVLVSDKFDEDEPNVAAYRGQLEDILKADLAYKKAVELVGSNKDFTAISKVLKGKEGKASDISFTQANIDGIGVEPSVGAAAFALPKGATSKVIEGINGLFVIKVDDKAKGANKDDFSNEQNAIQSQYGGIIQNSLIRTMVDAAKVSDKRAERLIK